ncbi:uncharacterized protein LOC112571911 [Pomacea canaliculata]|uniref:uncharacterized protein LOC112571911 n=1 Tax=Pomacea canaliculata TaxID=400727 RepID=UPI000D7255BC|nr:uncharacterized protein LOC112571911 [Pomacea canaliculata]
MSTCGQHLYKQTKTMLLKLCVMWLTAFCCHAQNAVNVALNKTTSQSTYYRAFTSGSTAVDGRTPGGDVTQFMTCIHTSENPRDEFPSWEVDLGHVYPVAYITIYGRPGFLHRMVDTTVIIDSITCFSIQKAPSTNRFNVLCTTALSGRIVRIERHSRVKKDFSLNMCEVQVWVCKDGKYGASCDQSCGHCEGETCDKDSGRCPRGCDPGWQGQQCHTRCRDGTYG